MSGRTGGHRATAVIGGAAVAALLLVALTGCSSGAGSPGELPATATGSTPAATAPSLSATPTDEAQIEAAVRAYFDAMDHAVKTGDTRSFLAVIASDCSCREFADAVEEKFSDGKLVGAEVSLHEVDVQAAAHQRAVAGAVYSTTPYQEIASDGSTKSYPGSRVQSSLVLVPGEDGWLVSSERVLERT